MNELLCIHMLAVMAIPAWIIGCMLLLEDRHDLGVLTGFLTGILAIVGVTLIALGYEWYGAVWIVPIASYIMGYILSQWLERIRS